jgi:ABC-type Fe2+-enterobactin transport system substrate-binding protein
VRSVDELARRLAEVEGAYAASIARAQDFSRFHLENAFSGLEASAQILCALHGQRVDGLAWEPLDTTITECG